MKTFFSLPFLLIYLLLIVLICWRRGYKRTGQGVIWGVIIGLYLFCTPLMSKVLLKIVGDYAPLTHAERVKEEGYQAIVVFGGGFYQGQEMHNDWQAGGYSLSRVRYAAHLAKASHLPILLSGFEAPAMAYTLSKDLATPVKWQELHSTTTDENARFSAEVLAQQGITRVVLVSDAWHMGRAKLAFERYGVLVLPAPTDFPMGFFEQKPALLQPKAALFLMNVFGLSECFGQVKYRVMYARQGH